MGSIFWLVNEAVNDVVLCLVFKFEASSMVNGDLMFSVRYDIGCFLVLIIVKLAWAGGYKAKFLILLPHAIVMLLDSQCKRQQLLAKVYLKLMDVHPVSF